MQSGKRNTKKWILEFDSKNTGINPLMGWESSIDTLSEINHDDWLMYIAAFTLITASCVALKKDNLNSSKASRL